ncbi:MAG TPA: LLM class flavin-dependent oxidoreductase, partial [Actinomycetota bacterium]|nr:LLM class flavin-dependent oxidoreductase [Actinomycetota bacterium]
YGERVAAAREACEREGRDPATLRLSLGLFTVVGEDEADLARRYELMRERLPPGVVDAVPLAELRRDGLVGTPGEVLERLDRFAALGVDELVVGPAPVWFALPDPSMLDLLADRVLPAAKGL